jgi:8-oxo-(d)GTP phosphatase
VSTTGTAERIDVRAAGAVVWREGPGGAVEIALVHRPRYDDWSFPKGKLDRGETMPFAAVREVREETGLDVRLGPALGCVTYAVPEGRKLVRYWAARAGAGEFAANSETDELAWVGLARARELLSYHHDVDMLARFAARGHPFSTLVLVRHAKAGSRSQWNGADDLRPLSSSGHEQAHQVTDLLALFGPQRLGSAPPLRCRDTIAPLATALRLPVTDEPLLGEDGWWDAPEAGLARVRALAATPGVTAVCSQGGVIPDAVGTLAAASPHPTGVDPDDVPARKASTWVLGFTKAGDLRSADHYPTPTG